MYDPVLWGTPQAIGNNNCLSYALGDYSNNRPVKATPGALAALRGNSRSKRELGIINCSSITRRVLLDNPGLIYRTKPTVPCKQGYYKVMLAVTKKGKGDSDFHWYRANGDVKYPVQPGDTILSIANMFQVPWYNVTTINDRFVLVKGSGTWSAKAGFATGALLRDSCNRLIFDPRRACRGTGNLQYKILCGSFCAARCQTKTA